MTHTAQPIRHLDHYVLLAYTHISHIATGVFIDYYGGEAESHIVQYAARLYFICKAGTSLEGAPQRHCTHPPLLCVRPLGLTDMQIGFN